MSFIKACSVFLANYWCETGTWIRRIYLILCSSIDSLLLLILVNLRLECVLWPHCRWDKLSISRYMHVTLFEYFIPLWPICYFKLFFNTSLSQIKAGWPNFITDTADTTIRRLNLYIFVAPYMFTLLHYLVSNAFFCICIYIFCILYLVFRFYFLKNERKYKKKTNMEKDQKIYFCSATESVKI